MANRGHHEKKRGASESVSKWNTRGMLVMHSERQGEKDHLGY
jgi:hypothetical protein